MYFRLERSVLLLVKDICIVLLVSIVVTNKLYLISEYDSRQNTEYYQ
jgi:hypothetical protein